MADVRTFKAATMQEALDVVRREMGPDAVILHTREMPEPRWWSFSASKARVEITAGLDINIRPPAARASRPKSSTAVAEPVARPAEPAARSVAVAEPPRRPTEPPRAPAPHHGDRMLAPPPPLLAPRRPEPARPAAPAAAAAAPSRAPVRPANTRPATAPLAPRSSAPMSHASPDVARRQPAPSITSPAPSTLATPSLAPPHSLEPRRHEPSDSHADIAQQLQSIRQMVESLSRQGPAARAEDVPPDLFHVYAELIDAEVEEDLARELVFRLKQHTSPEQLRDALAVKNHLRGMVEGEIRCTRPISVTPGRRKVVALVGPTGVGKTTTIAKLAANFRLREGVRMGLVTVDTYRIAAVEQLRTYAEIIDLPMKVVTSPLDMRRALDELAGLDLVLIDTAGRSPRDELKIQELKTLLAEALVDEVHLVLSMVASPRSLITTAETFASANATSVILTKLDEAPGMGSLLSLSRRVPLPISYVTTGQNVPDDIEFADPGRIARLVLGQESAVARRK